MTTKYGSSVNGDANINSANREDYVADMVFNFQKTFKERHKLLALLGYSYQVQNVTERMHVLWDLCLMR